MVEKMNAYGILAGKPEGMRPLGVVWTGLIWLWTGTSGGLLWTR
jgi:hypothetical protein